MSYFPDETLWKLRRRAGAVAMFVGSCLHLLRSSEVLKEAEAKRFTSSIESGLRGIAIHLTQWAKPEPLGLTTSYFWFDYGPEGFSVRMAMEGTEHEHPAEFVAVFAEDVTFADRMLTFRVSRSRLESMVADWLSRGRPIPGVIPFEIGPR
jgi:hypothetical protein